MGDDGGPTGLSDQTPTKRRETLEDTPLGRITLGEGISVGLMPGVDVIKGLTQIGEVVAIKRFPLRAFESVLDRTKNEVHALGNLSNPHIVHMLGMHQDTKFLYVIQDYAENGSLLDLVCEFGSLPESLSTGFIYQALVGLQYLHSQNVVHRNLKAANVLVTKTGTVKLCDFSVSSLWHQAIGLVELPHWKAPEVLIGAECTPACDIWSLGCTLIELLTGAPPFPDLDGEAAVHSILHREIPLPDCSEEIRQVLRSCLSKAPAERATSSALLRNPLFRNYSNQPSADYHSVRRSIGEFNRGRGSQILSSPLSPNRRVPAQDLARAKQNVVTVETELHKKELEYNTLLEKQKALQTRLDEISNHYSWTKLGASTVFRKLKSMDYIKNPTREQKKMIADWEDLLVQYFYKAFPEHAPPEFPRTTPLTLDDSSPSTSTSTSSTKNVHNVVWFSLILIVPDTKRTSATPTRFSERMASMMITSLVRSLCGELPNTHIVMMYDDIADNEKNGLWKGTIINEPGGSDVYAGVPKDYVGNDVTPRNFISVLKGESHSVKGKKVLKSTRNDDVFIYFADHGGKFCICFPHDVLHADTLISALNEMHDQSMYSKLVFYLEACESGSMFDNLLPPNVDVYAHTAATPDEPSYACAHDKQRNTYLNDCWSIAWMNDVEAHNPAGETLQEQFQDTKNTVTQSCPCQYGDLAIADDFTVADFMAGKGTYPSQKPNHITFMDMIVEEPYLSDTEWDFVGPTPSEDVDVMLLVHQATQSGDSGDRKKLHEEMVRRAATDNIDDAILSAARSFSSLSKYESCGIQSCSNLSCPCVRKCHEDPHNLDHAWCRLECCDEKAPSTLCHIDQPPNLACTHKLIDSMVQSCGPFTSYTIKHTKSIATLCQYMHHHNVPLEEGVAVIQSVCSK
ncbi:tick legumain [Pelomyxa schiedti]|nr:tick legumain [Pelomyxa schiedti]